MFVPAYNIFKIYFLLDLLDPTAMVVFSDVFQKHATPKPLSYLYILRQSFLQYFDTIFCAYK